MEDAVGGGEKLKETEREIKEEGGREGGRGEVKKQRCMMTHMMRLEESSSPFGMIIP
jgi:hypothetical protein